MDLKKVGIIFDFYLGLVVLCNLQAHKLQTTRIVTCRLTMLVSLMMWTNWW